MIGIVNIEFDANKATAVNNAIQDALVALIRAGTISILESVGYAGYTVGQLAALRGIQYDTSKGYAPMVTGYVHGTEALAKRKNEEGKPQ